MEKYRRLLSQFLQSLSQVVAVFVALFTWVGTAQMLSSSSPKGVIIIITLIPIVFFCVPYAVRLYRAGFTIWATWIFAIAPIAGIFNTWIMGEMAFFSSPNASGAAIHFWIMIGINTAVWFFLGIWQWHRGISSISAKSSQ